MVREKFIYIVSYHLIDMGKAYIKKSINLHAFRKKKNQNIYYHLILDELG